MPTYTTQWGGTAPSTPGMAALHRPLRQTHTLPLTMTRGATKLDVSLLALTFLCGSGLPINPTPSGKEKTRLSLTSVGLELEA